MERLFAGPPGTSAQSEDKEMLNTPRSLFSLIVARLGEDLHLAAVTLFQHVAHYVSEAQRFASNSYRWTERKELNRLSLMLSNSCRHSAERRVTKGKHFFSAVWERKMRTFSQNNARSNNR